MTSKVNESLRKLTSVSQSLNEITGKLNAQYEAIESALKKMNLGVEAWVEFNREKEYQPNLSGPLTYVEKVGYGRHEGKWAFLHAGYAEEMGWEPGDTGFLRDAPRISRLKAIERIPELLEKLAEETAKLHAGAEKSIAKAHEIADALSNER